MKTRLSGSHAILGQGIILFFFAPFNILLWNIVIRSNFGALTLLFAMCITVLSTLIIFLAFKTADVSIENGVLFVRTLFGTTRRPLQQFKKIGTLLPLGYYLEFEDRKRVYVLFGPDEIIRQFASSKPNAIIEEIKSLINRELNV